VHCADRIVAASNSKALRWSSAQSSAALPGYSSARRSTTTRARPLADRGRPTDPGYRRRVSRPSGPARPL